MKFVFTIIFFCYSCVSCIAQNKSDSIVVGTKKHINMIVAREYFRPNKFSFCFDGIEQPFRGVPFLIKYDSTDILHGYELGVYMPSLIYDSVLGLSIKEFYRVDSTFDSLSSKANEVGFFNRRMKRRVNRYNRRASFDGRFDGYFYFHVFKISADVIYLGKKDIIMPDFHTHKKNRLVKDANYDCYLITHFDSIEAYDVPRRE